jgi:hypothetical protein
MATGTVPATAKPSLSVKDARGNPSSTIPLSVEASSSALPMTVFVSGIPDGAKLSAGINSGQGIWTLQQNELAGLTMTLAPGSTGDFTLQVIAKDNAGVATQKSLAVQIGPTEFTPGTTYQKVGVLVFLLVAATLVLWLWFGGVSRVQAVANAEVGVPWLKPEGVVLKSGPPSFRYDPNSKQLLYRGLMDATQKEELVKLVASGGTEPQATAGSISFQGAIDQLAYRSNDQRNAFMLSIFLLGGISGIVGVLMRSLFNFVRVTCFENKFDWHRWWPWYLMRPALGFFLGLVCVLFVEADLFQPSGKSTAGLSWWIGIALLAGFASDDFIEKVRLIGQTIFGDASGKSQGKQQAPAS